MRSSSRKTIIRLAIIFIVHTRLDFCEFRMKDFRRKLPVSMKPMLQLRTNTDETRHEKTVTVRTRFARPHLPNCCLRPILHLATDYRLRQWRDLQLITHYDRINIRSRPSLRIPHFYNDIVSRLEIPIILTVIACKSADNNLIVCPTPDG